MSIIEETHPNADTCTSETSHIYAAYAVQIFNAGYSPLPIPRGQKFGDLPPGFSGYDGHWPSRADVQTWIEDQPHNNIAAKLPRNVIGIDVDAYGGKSGALKFDALCQQYGQLPLTWRVSSRFGDGYDGVSGILLFQIPAELASKAHDTNAGWVSGWDHVDLIRYGHRYVVAPESIHPRGTRYQVLNESTGEISDQMPSVNDLPMLPDSWCPALFKSESGRERRDKAESQWWTEGKACKAVATRLGQSLSELDTGRHDSCRDNLLALTRLGEQGHVGVREAVDQLHAMFIMAVTSEGERQGQRSPAKAETEWKGLVAGLDALIDKRLTDESDKGCCGSTVSEWVVSLPSDTESATEEQIKRFTSISFSDITERETRWIVPDLIPEGDAVILLGEEGIGKGLWWTYIIGKVTTGLNPIDVLIIVSEDDPERTVKPRLVASGADVSRVHLMVADPETLTGVPLIPGHAADVADMIEQTGSRLVIIDPWMSVVPGQLQIKDTQQARQALDPVVKLARQTGATFILVTHTNRTSTGSSRDKYGGTVALRQAGRVCLMALQDPDDDSMMYVGVEKANIVGKAPAVKYRKAGDGASWYLTPTDDPAIFNISELFATFSRDTDERSTDKWTQVALIAAQESGIITRSQITEVYEGNIKSADKAIARWRSTEPPRLLTVTGQRGVFEVNLPPATPHDPHHITTGGMGGNQHGDSGEPPAPPAIQMLADGELWGVSA